MSSRIQAFIETTYLIVLCILSSVSLASVFWWFAHAIRFRYALDYNEGIVWKQMVEIASGRGYAPVDGFPAIVFHYPPVFHLATAALAQTGIDPLVSGRLVSLMSTFGSALLVGDLSRCLISPARPPTRRVATVAAIIIFLLFQAVHTWAPQMRVDAIACFFALAGLWCVSKSDQRPALTYFAAVCFVLSAFSKQVSIVTAAASFGALLLLRPRRAVIAIATTVLLGIIALAASTWLTRGEFLRHLVLYNINRFEVERILPNLLQETRFDHPLLLVGATGYLMHMANVWRNLRDRSELSIIAVATLLFVPFATLSLVTTAKFGSSSSYYIQWEAGLAIFGSIALASLTRAASKQLAHGSLLRAGLLGALPLALVLWTLRHSDWSQAKRLETLLVEDTEIVHLLEPVKGDIISDEMAVLMRMHRDVVWEPAIFAELARAGRWNEQLVIDRIRNGRIGAVVSEGDHGKWFDEHYNPAVAEAMDQALPRKVWVGSRVVHLPAAPSSSPAGEVIGEKPSSAAGQR